MLESDPSSDFRPGDRVWGLTEIRKLRRTPGAHAEVTRCASELVDAMPAQLSFEEAASLPLVGLTASEPDTRAAQARTARLSQRLPGGVGLSLFSSPRRSALTVRACSAVNQDYAKPAAMKSSTTERTTCSPRTSRSTSGSMSSVITACARPHQMAWRCLPQHRQAGQHEREQLADAPPNSPQSSSRRAPDLAELRTLIDRALNPVIEEVYPLDRIGVAFERSRSQRTVGKLRSQWSIRSI